MQDILPTRVNLPDASLGNLMPLLDWSQATKVHSKNRKLEGVKITIEQVPVCNRVFISKIPDSVSSDHLRLAIEKQCGSDSVEDLDYKKGREYAIITFHNPKGISSFLLL